MSLLCRLSVAFSFTFFFLALATARADVYEFGSFQVNGLYLSSGGNVLTGEAAWTPLFNTAPISFRGQLGVFLPKNAFGDYFAALDYQALARLEIVEHLRLEAGGGAQTFTANNGGTSPVLSAGLSYDIGGLVNRIFVTYSHLFRSPTVDEVAFGVGLLF